jgi:alpha-amylase/alpha-mannosidase (GH57 family)
MTAGKPLPILFLWHHHQPCYRMPGADRALLPWVRLHAASGYTDMAATCEKEGARVTFNFTPVLLEQIEEQAKATIADEFEHLSRIPAHDLTEDQRAFVLEHFFAANWETLVRPIPRYADLLGRRGEHLEPGEALRKAKKFSDQDFLDLTVLFHLVWLGFTARKKPEIRDLLRKGRDFTLQERELVLGTHRELLQAVIPTHRRLWEEGLIELSTSPFAHPILPLLCDTNIAGVSLPKAVLPRTPFQFPDDARGQLEQGRKVFETHFGKPPAGLWPSEGSISEEALALASATGFAWAASDEENLRRSQRDGRDPGDAFEPFKFRTGTREITLFFRDKKLSDAIGFQYAHNPPSEAVADFRARLRSIADSTKGRPNRCVAVILDGENPWQSFPDGGEAFLTGLYQALNADRGLALSTCSEHLAKVQNPPVISGLHPGSWIDADFHIWIGDSEKNRAWVLLRQMRQRLELHANAALSQNDEVKRALYFAEGSDWFWWFGEPFHSVYEPDFDRLFRAFLSHALEAAGLSVPLLLQTPIALGLALETSGQPAFEMTPVLDGRVTSFYEWVGAVSLDTKKTGVPMGQTERLISGIHYGFDLKAFHLRMDFTDRLLVSKESALTVFVEMTGEMSATFTWPLRKGQDLPLLSVLREPEGLAASSSHARCAAADIVEISIPLAEVGLMPGHECAFAVGVSEGDLVRERVPREGVLRFKILSTEELAANWSI